MLKRAKVVEFGMSVFVNGHEFTGRGAAVIKGLTDRGMVAYNAESDDLLIIVSSRFKEACDYVTSEYYGIAADSFIANGCRRAPVKIDSKAVNSFLSDGGEIFS